MVFEDVETTPDGLEVNFMGTNNHKHEEVPNMAAPQIRALSDPPSTPRP